MTGKNSQQRIKELEILAQQKEKDSITEEQFNVEKKRVFASGPIGIKRKRKSAIIIISIVAVVLFCCTSTIFLFISILNTDTISNSNNSSHTNATSTDANSSTTTEESELSNGKLEAPYIIADDFKIKDLETIITIYGEPEIIYSEPPAFSLFSYTYNEYLVEGDFLKNDTRVFGAHLFFNDIKCSQDNFGLKTATSLLKYVQLEQYENNPNWILNQSYFKNYKLSDVDGWDYIYIQCGSEGDVAISFVADGWDTR